MRAFLALPMPGRVLDTLIALQGQIGGPGRAVPEDNLHLTIAFLGDTDERGLADLNDLLASTPLPVTSIRFGALGTFAEMERGLLFVSVEADAALMALHGKVQRVARMAGITLPRRRFRPHVTLFRSNRQPKGPERDRLARALSHPVQVPDFEAHQLVLFRSTLGPGGARHDAMASYALSPLST